MKKRISILLVLTLTLALFSSVMVYADDNTVVVDGVTFSADMKTLIKYPNDKTDTHYTIPDGVTSIGDSAFESCDSLTSIDIPDSVTSIGDSAFAKCISLTSITIPDSVASIGDNAFSYCKKLADADGFIIVKGVLYDYIENATSITIPNGVTSIDKGVFQGRSDITSIILPDGMTSIGAFAFSYCTNLTSINIPDEVTTIGHYAFEGCESLISINIPDSVLSIGECAFFGCSNLTNITISDRVIEIYGRTFLGCKSLANKGDFLIVNNILYNYAGNAASVNIPDGVTTIGYSAFNSCESLISINIPNSVTDIGLFAFDQCTNLQRINIPASVTYIGLFAFSDCSSLTDVYYGADEISWKNIEVDSNNECLQTANIHFTEPDKSEIKVTLYGKKLSFDQPPVIENGRTLVPLRAIFEALDAEVTWENGTRTVRATRDGTYIELQIDSNEMKVNTQIITLDVPAKIINDRTMVPARAVAEAFGCNVSWDAENNAVIIN